MTKFYTYMGSLIKYEYIGTASPAGVARHSDMPPIEVYRNNSTSQIFYRTVEDFHERMTEADSPFLAVPEWARGGGMIKLDLTTQQITDLMLLNHTYIDVPASMKVYRGDVVQAADRLCHVTAVTENAHFESKRVSLRMGV